MKVVFDTDVVVAAFRSPTGASAVLIKLARHGQIQPVVSVPLVFEYEAKLTMEEHLNAAQLQATDAQKFIDVLIDVSEWTRIFYSWRPQTRDPADEMVLEAAINAKADAIVTFNLKDYGQAPQRFGILCLRPGEALEKVG
jgi:putative PIN family toxin of toxin-antitoxin system